MTFTDTHESATPSDPLDDGERREPGPPGARPGARERLVERGAESLSTEDLVAILLGTGTAREPVAVLAARVLVQEHRLYPAVLRRFAVGDRTPVIL